jgi:hypothetical protein
MASPYNVAPAKVKRRVAGCYSLGEWTISRTEGDDRSPGYQWVAEHPDRGEFYTRTLAEAVAAIRSRGV